jgi:16S rRNA (cytosine967-C5)-methyltransferase
VTPAARIAGTIELLDAIETAPQRPADAVASEWFRARRFIGAGDRRAIADRVWSVIRARRRLEWWLRDTAPTARLLVGAALLLEGGSLAALARLYSGEQFAPARLTVEDRAALAPLEHHTLDHPATPKPVRLEVPDWILPRLEARFGEACAAELSAMLAPAPLDLRVNALKATRAEAQAALAKEGIAADPTPFSPWGLRVDVRRSVVSTRAFRAGLVEIQDEGSQLVAALVGAAPGMRVADFCAGAGGKALALAMAMSNRGHLVTCDVAPPRLAEAARRLRRAGAHNAETHVLAPGDKWVKRHAGGFDRVLVDAPCTGTGTWRRNPAARLRLGADGLQRLIAEQKAILDLAGRLVRIGGRLVYATCSVLIDENEAQVSAFLARQPDFSPLPLQRAWRGPGAPPVRGDHLLLTPRQHGTDGFFAAVLERVR